MIGICYIICPILLLVIRHILAKENKRRDAEPADTTFDEVYIETVDADGKKVERKVDKVWTALRDETTADNFARFRNFWI